MLAEARQANSKAQELPSLLEEILK